MKFKHLFLIFECFVISFYVITLRLSLVSFVVDIILMFAIPVLLLAGVIFGIIRLVKKDSFGWFLLIISTIFLILSILPLLAALLSKIN